VYAALSMKFYPMRQPSSEMLAETGAGNRELLRGQRNSTLYRGDQLNHKEIEGNGRSV
jgi:hypothetical protein